jgi:hypothetical protein
MCNTTRGWFDYSFSDSVAIGSLMRVHTISVEHTEDLGDVGLLLLDVLRPETGQEKEDDNYIIR